MQIKINHFLKFEDHSPAVTSPRSELHRKDLRTSDRQANQRNFGEHRNLAKHPVSIVLTGQFLDTNLTQWDMTTWENPGSAQNIPV